MKRIHVIISGRVQGVFFRASTQEKAVSLGIKGWVRNNDDGSVEAVFQGSETTINTMLNWCHSGSSSSRVDSIKTTELNDDTLYTGFEILL